MKEHNFLEQLLICIIVSQKADVPNLRNDDFLSRTYEQANLKLYSGLQSSKNCCLVNKLES